MIKARLGLAIAAALQPVPGPPGCKDWGAARMLAMASKDLVANTVWHDQGLWGVEGSGIDSLRGNLLGGLAAVRARGLGGSRSGENRVRADIFLRATVALHWRHPPQLAA